jgi:hypothetical protein
MEVTPPLACPDEAMIWWLDRARNRLEKKVPDALKRRRVREE